MANFDAARYLCQWSRLARAAGGNASPSKPVAPRKVARYVSFDKSHRKEQGLFVYQDPSTGLAISSRSSVRASPERTLRDPRLPASPGVFDWPVDKYLPIMQPELTFGDKVIIPSFYGKNITTSMGLRTIHFNHDQPDLITKGEEFVTVSKLQVIVVGGDQFSTLP